MSGGLNSKYPHMSSGDDASKFLNADTLNRLMGDTARLSKFQTGNNRYNFSSSSPSVVQKALSGDPSVIIVKSAYAFNLPRFAPVGIDDVAYRIITNQDNVWTELTDEQYADLDSAASNIMNAPVFYCTKPSYPRHNYRYGIIQQSLGPCEVGLCVVSGYTSAYMTHLDSQGSYPRSSTRGYRDDARPKADVSSDVYDYSNILRHEENASAVLLGVDDFDHLPAEAADEVGLNKFYNKDHALRLTRRDFLSPNGYYSSIASVISAQKRSRGDYPGYMDTKFYAPPYHGYGTFECSGSRWVEVLNTCEEGTSVETAPERYRDSGLNMPCTEGDTVTSVPCNSLGEGLMFGNVILTGNSNQAHITYYNGFKTCEFSSRCRYECIDDGEGGWEWRQFSFCNAGICACPEVPDYYPCGEDTCPREVTFSCSLGTTTTETTTSGSTSSTTTTSVPCEYAPSRTCYWQCVVGEAFDTCTVSRDDEGATGNGRGWQLTSPCPNDPFRLLPEGCLCPVPDGECDVCNNGELAETELQNYAYVGDTHLDVTTPSLRAFWDNPDSNCRGTCSWRHNATLGSRLDAGSWEPTSYCSGGCPGGGVGAIYFGGDEDTINAADCGSLSQAELDSRLATNPFLTVFTTACDGGTTCDPTSSTTSTSTSTSTSTTTTSTTTSTSTTTTSTTTTTTTTTAPPTTTSTSTTTTSTSTTTTSPPTTTTTGTTSSTSSSTSSTTTAAPTTTTVAPTSTTTTSSPTTTTAPPTTTSSPTTTTSGTTTSGATTTTASPCSGWCNWTCTHSGGEVYEWDNVGNSCIGSCDPLPCETEPVTPCTDANVGSTLYVGCA